MRSASNRTGIVVGGWISNWPDNDAALPGSTMRSPDTAFDGGVAITGAGRKDGSIRRTCPTGNRSRIGGGAVHMNVTIPTVRSKRSGLLLKVTTPAGTPKCCLEVLLQPYGVSVGYGTQWRVALAGYLEEDRSNHIGWRLTYRARTQRRRSEGNAVPARDGKIVIAGLHTSRARSPQSDTVLARYNGRDP